MAKYIDADLLRKEIEKNTPDRLQLLVYRDIILALIDSLQQEQPKVDLEKEIEQYTEETIHLPITHKRTPMDIMESDWVRCAHHFYKLGKNSK